MVNWSDIVSGQTAGGFRTIDGTTYGYRNDIQVNEARGINIIGNPVYFFSTTPTSITDGRSRNALRMFVYNALRAESDYTDAQAAAWGSATADELLYTRATVVDPRDAQSWPIPTGVSGSRVTSTGASTTRLTFVAIRDRSGHTRAWRIKSSIPTVGTSNFFTSSYDKLTDAQIRTEFGLSGGTPATPTAVAGTLSIANKTASLSSAGSGTLTLEAASGGTGTVGYALSVNGGTSCTLSGRTLTIPAGQAAGTFRLAVTATWTSGTTTATASAFFNLTITRTQAPARGTFSPSAKSFSTTSSGSGSVTVDAASGGTGTITYQLRRPHATGLSLSGRTLSIASNTPAGAHTVTIRAIWTTPEGTQFTQASFTLTVTRSQAPSAGTFSVANKTLSLSHDGSGTFTLETASGGTGTITYTLVSPPTGITLSGRTVSVASAVAAGSISLTARATWTTSEGSRTADSTFTLAVQRAAAPAVGLAANARAKLYSNLDAQDKAAFYEWTWTASGTSFYGNPTNGYGPGTKEYSGANKTAGFNGWLNGHVRTLLRNIDQHWCTNSYAAKRVLLIYTANNAGSSARWNACGTLQGTGNGNFGQGAGITDIVIEDSRGQARYFKRSATAGAANYAAAGFVEQTEDMRFYTRPAMEAEDVPRAMGQRTIAWLSENDLRQDFNREIEYPGSKK